MESTLEDMEGGYFWWFRKLSGLRYNRKMWYKNIASCGVIFIILGIQIMLGFVF